MAGRYPDYDWRGIAMLTQQLGQLFEPSKTRLMSQQQEHEMGMLMAKQSYATQTKELEQLRTEYEGIVGDLKTQTSAVESMGLGELANVGAKIGANTDQSAEMFDKLDVKKLSDMQVMANKYREMIRTKQGALDDMISFNEQAKAGQNFRAGSMQKKRPKSGVIADYYDEANKDGIAGLSFEEGQNAIKSFIKDNFLVAEGEEGMQMTFGSGDQADSFRVKPEAIAFRAGWESGTGTGTGRGKAETAEISQKAKSPGIVTQQTMDEWLNLDAAYMNLSQEERKAIDQALVTPGVAVPPELRDTVEQMKRMNKISVDLAGSKMGEYAQPLPDSVFEPEMKDLSWMPTGDTAVPKEWVEITIGDKKQPGLTKELYDSLRKLGTNAKDPRKALEYTIRNWENIAPEKRNAYILQIISQHSGIIAELSK